MVHSRQCSASKREAFIVAGVPCDPLPWLKPVTHLPKAAVLELQFGDQLQKPNQGCAFMRSELTLDLLIGSHPGLD